MINKNIPRVRSLLVSEPFMLDPNFIRSVVILCEHDENGTVGLVLNQPSNLQVKDVVENMPDVDFPLYIGGPVGIESIQFIHKCGDRLSGGVALGDGISWGGNFEALILLLENKEIDKDEIKFFMGYSGWTEGQLESELKDNTWMVSNDFNPDIVFVHDEENLWKEAVVNLGPKYAHVAQFPQNPMWN